MRYWQAPHGKWLHLRLGAITCCGKRIVLETWIMVRQTPPPDDKEICPACLRREDARAIAPYINVLTENPAFAQREAV